MGSSHQEVLGLFWVHQEEVSPREVCWVQEHLGHQPSAHHSSFPTLLVYLEAVIYYLLSKGPKLESAEDQVMAIPTLYAFHLSRPVK